MIKNNGRIRTADLFEFFKLESKKQRLYMNYETDGAEGETLQIVRGNSRIFSKRFIYHALRMIQRIFLLA